MKLTTKVIVSLVNDADKGGGRKRGKIDIKKQLKFIEIRANIPLIWD